MSAAQLAAARALVIAAALCGATALAHAQDPSSSVVQGAAREWLAGTDTLDGSVTWRTAGVKFRQAITVERWTESLSAVREPMGAVESRTAAETTLGKSLPGVRDGEYATLVFHTSFANKADASETLRLEHEPDGAWRVIGYFIR
jgi:hypothetical protein